MSRIDSGNSGLNACHTMPSFFIFLSTGLYSAVKFFSQVIERIKENSELIEEYEKLATDLLEWIQITIVKLSDRNFANTLVGVQQQMLEFNQYRTQEKPPR